MLLYQGYSYLGTGTFFLHSYLLNNFSKLDVSIKVSGLKSTVNVAEVILGEVVKSLQLARQPAAVQGVVANQWNAKLAARIGNATFLKRVPRKHAELDLNRSGRVDYMGALYSLCIHFVKTVGPDFALLD